MKSFKSRRPSVALGAMIAGLCCVFSLTAGGPVGAATGAAQAASGWAVQPLPLGNWTDSEITAVSCGAAKTCVGVGDYTDLTDNQTALAEGWNGQAWSRQPTPPAEHDTGSTLDGISCPAANACMAVGAVTQTWNGTAWTLRPAIGLGGANPGNLAGVSCPAADACMAVGNYFPHNDSVPLAEAWNGKAWKLEAAPVPPGSPGASFNAVSCAAASACVAVGSYAKSSASSVALALAESWNGKTWTIEQAPSPQGVGETDLNGVSCTAASACIAAGDDGTFVTYHSHSGHAFVPLSEVWNGKAWTIKPVPAPAHSTGTYLDAVSCGAVNSCTAVGGFVLGTTTEDTLAEVWNGQAWQVQTTPNPSGNSSELYAVSCRGANVCAAAGAHESESQAFVEGEGGL